MTRQEQAKAAWQTVKDIIVDTVRDTGGTPSGHLYALLMSHMSLDIYQKMLAELKAEGKIEEKAFFLTAK